MGNRNRGNIKKFPVKPDKADLLKQAVNGIADDMVRSFSEMISAKIDALNWAIDQLPKMLAAAGLPAMHFEVADGLYPFLLTGFSDIDEEEENSFQGMFPCFTSDEDLPAGIEQYALLLVVNDDEEETPEEGSHRIDALLARIADDGTACIFDGEDWTDLDEMLEDDDDDDEDYPF